MNRNKFLLNKIYKMAEDLTDKDYMALRLYDVRKVNINKFLQDLTLKISDKDLSDRLSGIYNRLNSYLSQEEMVKELRNLENVLNKYCDSCKDMIEYKNLKAQVDHLFFSPEKGEVMVPPPPPTPSPKKPSPQEYFNNLIGAVNGKVNKYKNEYPKNFEAAEYIPDAVKQEFDNLDKNAIKELNRIFTSTSNENVKNTIRTAIKNLKDNISSEIIAAMPNLHFSAVDVAPTNYIKSTEPEELSWKDFTGPKTLRVNQP